MNSETKSIKQLWRGFYVLLAVLVLLDPKLLELLHVIEPDPHHQARFVVDGLPEFYALFGLGICVAYILAKLAIGKIVMRPETFYAKSPLDPTRDSKGRPLGSPADESEAH